jgi:hypothetical protein
MTTSTRAEMTEHLASVPSARGPSPGRKRLSKGTLRAWAWAASGVSFLVPSAILAIAPRPASSATPTAPVTPPRQVVIIHHVIRKIIVQQAPKVVAGSGSVSAPVVTTTGGGAPPPPVTSSGGSHP